MIAKYCIFQGVHGAYSESAAQKAYPNCEAVPCEQFETAFDVKFCYPSLFTTISNMLLPLVLFIQIKLEVWLGSFYKNQSRMSLALI